MVDTMVNTQRKVMAMATVTAMEITENINNYRITPMAIS